MIISGRAGVKYLLVDSGAACHVCPPDWASSLVAPVASQDVQQPGPAPISQEAPLAEAAKQPAGPTPEEIAQHELTHLPAVPWCEACIKGRGRDAPHRDKQGHNIDAVLPVIQCDYGFLTEPSPAGESSSEGTTVLFASCRASTNLFATVCSNKGPTDKYAVTAMASWLWELGHPRMILQCDGEPAIEAFVTAVRDRVVADGKAEQVTCQVAPVGSHQSNGAV